MSKVNLDGNPLEVSGTFPQPGDTAPDFTLTTGDLQDVGLDHFAGKRKILNIIPSIDTGVCAASTRKFNEKAGGLDNTEVLVISADQPFAAGRFWRGGHRGRTNPVQLPQLQLPAGLRGGTADRPPGGPVCPGRGGP